PHRRGADAGQLALLGGGDLPDRHVAAVVRQAVRSRLAHAVWLGQGVRTAPAAGRHRGANTRAVSHRLPSVGRQAPVPTQGAQRVRATARVIVTPKPVVNDPQGLTVKQGLVTLGFREVEDVRIGKYIELSLEAETMHEARERVEAMYRRLLADHVLEDCHSQLDP